MKQNPSISVIMPVYNQGDYVGEAIESILNQTYTDFEFIIVNDGSIDNTEDSVLSYTDERIIYVKNGRNLGNYPARNIGMQMAKGKYIAVMDADDIALPIRLERQFMYMEGHPEISAIGSWFRFSDNLQQYKNPVEDKKIRIALLRDNCFTHSSLLIRSEVLRNLNGYKEQFKFAADYDLVCQIALDGKVWNLPECLVIYRRHSQQISQKYLQIQQMYANKIRIRYQLDFIERYGKKEMTCVDLYDVGNAELGRLISMYVYARSKEDELVEKQANKLLDTIVDKIYAGVIENSFHVGCGLLCLLRNNLVLGDEDESLEDLDRQLDSSCMAMNPEDRNLIYGWIHYLCLRIEGKKDDDALFLIRNKQNLISFLCYLDRIDLYEGNSTLIEDIRKIDSMRLCPTITKRLLEIKRRKEDVTFIISVRIDSKERETNLDWVVEQLSQRENTTILILEADIESCYKLKKEYEHVTLYFVEDHDPVFHRTRYLNRLISLAETSIIGVWDTDVILPDKQIEEAIATIGEKKAVLCYPYDGRFCWVSKQKSMLLIEETAFNFSSFLLEDLSFIATNSLGGAFFINKEFYLQAGGENEYFYGWGCEDLERCKRIEILGGTVSRISGKLYHLYHPRKENSWYGNTELEIRNRKEFLKVCGMTKEELEKYIESWKKNDISGGVKCS